MKAAVSQGKIGFAMAWWPLPLALLVIAAVMFWWRMTQKPGPIEWAWQVAQRAGLGARRSAVVR
jgi:uncharacterized membrane protein YhhN